MKPSRTFRSGDRLADLARPEVPVAVVRETTADGVVVAETLKSGREFRFGRDPDFSGHTWVVVSRD